MKKSIFKRWWFWVIAVIVAIGIIGSAGGNSDNTPATSTPNNTVATAGQNTDSAIDGKVCEIISAEVGGKNYEGKPTVVITYKYTNNSDEAASFDLSFTDKVFQNGIECSPDYVYEVDEDNSSKEIRPGATIEVKKSYILNDETSDVEVEIAGFITWDNTVITKTFSIVG